jgi:hypothetical protein
MNSDLYWNTVNDILKESLILFQSSHRPYPNRFPNDFAFQLSNEEWINLKFQIGTSSSHGGRRTPPFVFTEQGVAMLSSVYKQKLH